MIQVVGNINFDITAMLDKTRNIEENRVLELDPGIGGTAANTAIQLAKLGQKVILNGTVGNDMFGQWLLKELAKRGVKVEYIRVVDGERTGFCFVSVRDDGHRFLFTFRGINEKNTLEVVALEETTFLHLAGISTMQAGRILKGLKKNIPISYAPGGIVSFEDPEGVLELSEYITYLIFNEKEWEAVSKTGTLKAEHVVVTKGNKGTELLPEGIFASAYKAEVVDTTGAGDAFNAGFIHAISSGGNLDEALRLGNALGALNVQYKGATGKHGLHEIKSFIYSCEPSLRKFV
ncbi:hypothetical protein AT15_08095 [Kosmotoga arenicorallina S304]|uniref:Carbohydrate kinase PfkB domain-containing protein n=1 Tax=Kosmotoga arenicorallina S304 TaxID=1453497 RepID=A0A182C7C5_9BACT|nr:PfkB family carbohydrate kinase [Kosmotoga arenicorallina]OAA31445.1 hypothetical protein AT15_08095 [Kosmotoga arenicorallina S304]